MPYRLTGLPATCQRQPYDKSGSTRWNLTPHLLPVDWWMEYVRCRTSWRPWWHWLNPSAQWLLIFSLIGAYRYCAHWRLNSFEGKSDYQSLLRARMRFSQLLQVEGSNRGYRTQGWRSARAIYFCWCFQWQISLPPCIPGLKQEDHRSFRCRLCSCEDQKVLLTWYRHLYKRTLRAEGRCNFQGETATTLAVWNEETKLSPFAN